MIIKGNSTTRLCKFGDLIRSKTFKHDDSICMKVESYKGVNFVDLTSGYLGWMDDNCVVITIESEIWVKYEATV